MNTQDALKDRHPARRWNEDGVLEAWPAKARAGLAKGWKPNLYTGQKS